MTLGVTLLAHGGSLQAIVVALGFAARIVAHALGQAGIQGQAVQPPLVEPPRDLGRLPAEESRVKQPGGLVWMALAMRLSTPVWRAGAVSAHPDLPLIRRLLARVCACARKHPLWCGPDGLGRSIRATRESFRDTVRTGERGRPRRRAWPGLLIAQVIKRDEKRRVVEVARDIVPGAAARHVPARDRLPLLHAACERAIAEDGHR